MNPGLDQIRPSPIAGRWYESDPIRLRKTIQQWLGSGKPLDDVVGLVAPHAGHVYSGATAAKAYQAAANLKTDTIVLLSPHHAFTARQCVSSGFGAYATPLGNVPVDHPRLAELNIFLQSHGLEGIHFAGVESEHAIEIQLPFLQTLYSRPFSIIPLMLREFTKRELDVLVEGLYEVTKGSNPLIVSSTDLSHFYPQDEAEKLDGRLIEALGKYSISDTVKALTMDGSEACGATGLLVCMALTQKMGGKKMSILEHTTSAAITHDKNSVVGYLAAAITS